MEEIRNSANKLICRIDKQSKSVEIVLKGNVTIVRFLDDGNVEIINANRAT